MKPDNEMIPVTPPVVPPSRPTSCSAKVPIDVMRDIRRKSDEYRSLAKRLWKEAELMTAKAEQLEKTGQELRDLADAWKRMFPDTQDCV